jgi:hypothetical protein
VRGIIMVLPSRRRQMNMKKIFGFVAVAGLLFVAAPTERAQAISLNGPGIATAVQNGPSESLTTEVQYRRAYRGYRMHRGFGRRHHGWGRPHFYGRRHFRGRY